MTKEDRPDTQHPEYAVTAPLWAKCRVAAAGEEAVHAGGAAYLPQLTGQDANEYSAYRGRALFFNATGRTIDGMSGLVFRRPPTIELPAKLKDFEQDVDTADTPLIAFSEKAVEELLTVGRFGLMADYPRMPDAQTLADQQAANGRPYVRMYAAESILNWRVERVNNRSVLTLVVLSEVHEEAADFETSVTPQCRVLRLTAGRYTVEIWRKQKDANGQEKWMLAEPAFAPTMGAKTLDYIPFLLCGPMGIDPCVSKPPLLDLVNVNLSHYRTTADYEHGLHFTGLPTPVITGHSFDIDETGRPKNNFALGSATVKAFPDPNAKAFFMEFAGTGLGALSKRLEEKEQMMAALGARMLAAEKRQVEAAETAAIHRAGESSVLASLAIAAGAALSRVLTWCATWEGATEAPLVKLNTDYMPSGLSAQELSELVKSWQAGAISHETLYDNLARGEVARQGVDFETEKSAIEEEGPALGTMNGGGDGIPAGA